MENAKEKVFAEAVAALLGAVDEAGLWVLIILTKPSCRYGCTQQLYIIYIDPLLDLVSDNTSGLGSCTVSRPPGAGMTIGEKPSR